MFAVVFGFLKLCKLLNITENEFEIGLDKLYHRQKGSAGTSLNRVKTKARTHYHSGGSTLGRFVIVEFNFGNSRGLKWSVSLQLYYPLVALHTSSNRYSYE